MIIKENVENFSELILKNTYTKIQEEQSHEQYK